MSAPVRTLLLQSAREMSELERALALLTAIDAKVSSIAAALPADDEFPFVYDARTAVSYPKRKKRGRRLDVGGDDDVISHLMSMAESVFLLFTASVNSSTLVSNSALRLSNSLSIDRHV